MVFIIIIIIIILMIIIIITIIIINVMGVPNPDRGSSTWAHPGPMGIICPGAKPEPLGPGHAVRYHP